MLLFLNNNYCWGRSTVAARQSVGENFCVVTSLTISLQTNPAFCCCNLPVGAISYFMRFFFYHFSFLSRHAGRAAAARTLLCTAWWARRSPSPGRGAENSHRRPRPRLVDRARHAVGENFLAHALARAPSAPKYLKSQSQL